MFCLGTLKHIFTDLNSFLNNGSGKYFVIYRLYELEKGTSDVYLHRITLLAFFSFTGSLLAHFAASTNTAMAAKCHVAMLLGRKLARGLLPL